MKKNRPVILPTSSEFEVTCNNTHALFVVAFTAPAELFNFSSKRNAFDRARKKSTIELAYPIRPPWKKFSSIPSKLTF